MIWSAVLAAFLASFVEFVEALTVILAVGATRGWRSALGGAAAATLVLAGLVAALGPALQRINLRAVQLAVGVLVLLFALRWLRKAVLRALGVIPLHDEAQAYASATARLGQGGSRHWDWPGFAAAFQVTMLEGTEVVFIVVALGAGGARLVPASLGAAAALAVVAALGVALHRPLSSIPENVLKTLVGILLAAFGTFWTGEAIGVAWPGGDAALSLLALFWAAVTLGLVALGRAGRMPA